MDIAVRYCSKTKFGNTRRIAEAIGDGIGVKVVLFTTSNWSRRTVLALKKMLKGKGITVCEDYFYAHMLNIDGKLEAAKEFGKRMIEK